MVHRRHGEKVSCQVFLKMNESKVNHIFAILLTSKFSKKMARELLLILAAFNNSEQCDSNQQPLGFCDPASKSFYSKPIVEETVERAGNVRSSGFSIDGTRAIE